MDGLLVNDVFISSVVMRGVSYQNCVLLIPHPRNLPTFESEFTLKTCPFQFAGNNFHYQISYLKLLNDSIGIDIDILGDQDKNADLTKLLCIVRLLDKQSTVFHQHLSSIEIGLNAEKMRIFTGDFERTVFEDDARITILITLFLNIDTPLTVLPYGSNRSIVDTFFVAIVIACFIFVLCLRFLTENI